MNNIKEEPTVFGLDIGTRKVVGTVGYRQGEKFVVVAQEIREHQTRAMLDGQIHDINRVAATVADIKETLQDKTGLKLEEVCIAAAGRVLKTMNVHVDMDLDRERNVTREDMSTLISMGVDNALAEFQEKNDTDMHFYCVGHSVVKYYINGLWMSEPEHHKAKTLGADLIATFLPDDVVDGLHSAVELAGLKVESLTLEPIAAIRVAIPEKFRLLNIAMVDVGAGTSDISITDDGSIIAFGMLPCAGDSFTERIAKTCLIDFASAEKIKIAASEQKEIKYEDIMGMEQTITAEEVLAICQPEIERMAKLTAGTIQELNGGSAPSAVFIVGGGGRIKGFDEKIAQELGLDFSRVAIRGEEIMNNIEFPAGALKDSTIITPIGICLTQYEKNNNFIYITFNGKKIKLYDNNKLTVMDAAVEADFPREGLFPRRGERLHYTVNGKNRVTKGEYGESAHVYLNGESVDLSHSIRANDIISVEASTVGADAQEKIAELVDCNGKITVVVNGEEMQLPKPVRVNGKVVTGEYMIQNGDQVEVFFAYPLVQFCEYMGVSTEDMFVYLNGREAKADAVIYNADKIDIKSKKGIVIGNRETQKSTDMVNEMNAAAQKTDTEAQNAAASDNTVQSIVKEEPVFEQANTSGSFAQETVKEEQNLKKKEENTEEMPKEESKETVGAQIKADNAGVTKAQENEGKKQEAKEAQRLRPEFMASTETEVSSDGSRKIIVIVNQEPIVMKGKKNYAFVDIFDYIDFDTSKMQGAGIVTTVNGKDAQYTQELYNGDKIEIYWKKD